jgi:hypothetical protein
MHVYQPQNSDLVYSFMIVGKILEQGNDWNVKWDMLNHNTGPFFCKAFLFPLT